MAYDNDRNEPRAEEPDENFGVDETRARRILERGARKVKEEDAEDLTSTLREKVGELKELEEGLHWVGTLIGRAKLLFAMIRDRNFQIDMTKKLLVIAGLLYFVVPTDWIPDFIPGVGYIDDALVLGTLWNIVIAELDRYIEYLDESQKDEESLDSLAFGSNGTAPSV